MEIVDIAIIVFSFILLIIYFIQNRKFFEASIILYIILSSYIGIVSYNDYQGVVELYIGSEAGSLGAVPDIVESINTTFGLFMIYSFINIIFLSLFYKKQLKQSK